MCNSKVVLHDMVSISWYVKLIASGRFPRSGHKCTVLNFREGGKDIGQEEDNPIKGSGLFRILISAHQHKLASTCTIRAKIYRCLHGLVTRSSMWTAMHDLTVSGQAVTDTMYCIVDCFSRGN